MRCVHAHFPISLIISKDKRQVEVKNFLGGKKGHTINRQDALPPSPRTLRMRLLLMELTMLLSLSAVLRSLRSARLVPRMSVNSLMVSSFQKELLLIKKTE